MYSMGTSSSLDLALQLPEKLLRCPLNQRLKECEVILIDCLRQLEPAILLLAKVLMT